MDIEEELQSLSVRIECTEEESENTILGSGVWWFPSKESEYIYIFTAGHVMKDRVNVVVHYFDYELNDLTVSIEQNDIDIYKDYKYEKNQLPLHDVAVIRCKKSRVIGVITKTYKLKKTKDLKDNKKMILRGFPNVLNVQESFISSNKKLEIIYESTDEKLKLFTYALNSNLGINVSDRNNELEGFSGSGIFSNDKNGLVLLGIHSNAVGVDAALATCGGMLPELLIEICKEKKWNIPEYVSDIYGNLSDCVNNFYAEIENDELVGIMNHLVDLDFTKVMKCSFCGNSEECNQIDYPYQCNTFRRCLLIVLCVLKYLNNSIDFENPYLIKKEKKVPVRYICCDGEEGLERVAMKHFIRSLKTDYLMRKKLDNGSLVIWNSKKPAIKDDSCTSKGFKKILKDIKEDLRRDKDFDILKGFRQSNEISIIHINKIIDSIEEDTLDKMVNLIMESI